MYGGAILSAIDLIVGLATIGSLKAAIKKADPTFTATQLHNAEVGLVLFAAFFGLIGIGLWIWMALANKVGKELGQGHRRGPGRHQYPVRAALPHRPHASLGLVFSLLVWLAGVGAVILLCRPESSQYFTAMPGNRPQPG